MPTRGSPWMNAKISAAKASAARRPGADRVFTLRADIAAGNFVRLYLLPPGRVAPRRERV